MSPATNIERKEYPARRGDGGRLPGPLAKRKAASEAPSVGVGVAPSWVVAKR
jgi:hypothetical protein